MVLYRLKGNVEFALRAGFQVVKGLGKDLKTSRFFVNVEVIQQRVSVAQYAKHAGSFASESRCAGPEIKLGKVQNQRVAIPRVNRNGVGEVPIPLRSEQVGVGCLFDLRSVLRDVTIQEKVIRVPELAAVVGEGSRLGNLANGKLSVRCPGEDLDRT